MAYKWRYVVKWLYLIVLLLICACTPQQRMARLLRKHPELIKRDTVWRIETLPPIHITDNAKISVADSTAIDSLLGVISDCGQDTHIQIPLQEAKKKAASGLRNQIFKPCLSDTLRGYKDGVRIKIWQVGDRIFWDIQKDAKQIKIPVQTNDIQHTIHEKVIPSWMWWIIVFASCIIVITGIRLMLRLGIH